MPPTRNLCRLRGLQIIRLSACEVIPIHRVCLPVASRPLTVLGGDISFLGPDAFTPRRPPPKSTVTMNNPHAERQAVLLERITKNAVSLMHSFTGCRLSDMHLRKNVLNSS